MKQPGNRQPCLRQHPGVRASTPGRQAHSSNRLSAGD